VIVRFSLCSLAADIGPASSSADRLRIEGNPYPEGVLQHANAQSTMSRCLADSGWGVLSAKSNGNARCRELPSNAAYCSAAKTGGWRVGHFLEGL
jgi:hypothetical protein